MSDEDKKNKGESIEGVVFQTCPSGHVHYVGKLEGTLHREDQAEQGEVVYEDKNSGFVGGGNPRYSANYDNMDWN